MRILKLFTLLLLATLITSTANANHSWGKYHWNLSTEDTEFSPLELVNNMTSIWQSSLTQASTDWDQSVLKNAVTSGGGNTNCDPTQGKIEVCNDEYGSNGWLGIASIWATRGRSGHIVQGVVKLNDTYFNTEYYNTQPWRDTVVCQEIGHTLGLDHQDENFYNTNLGTCMDYTNDPDGSLFSQLDNRRPNAHDYEMMVEMYAHLNSTDEGGGPGNGKGGGNGNRRGKPADVGVTIDLNDPSEWGSAIRQDAAGNDSLFERQLPNGQVLITHVLWID